MGRGSWMVGVERQNSVRPVPRLGAQYGMTRYLEFMSAAVGCQTGPVIARSGCGMGDDHDSNQPGPQVRLDRQPRLLCRHGVVVGRGDHLRIFPDRAGRLHRRALSAAVAARPRRSVHLLGLVVHRPAGPGRARGRWRPIANSAGSGVGLVGRHGGHGAWPRRSFPSAITACPPSCRPGFSWSSTALGMVVFGGLVAGGVVYRHQPEAHKRLMLCAAVSILGPGLGRMPIVQAPGPAGAPGHIRRQ